MRDRLTDHLLLKDNLTYHITYSPGIGVWRSGDAIVDHNTLSNAHDRIGFARFNRPQPQATCATPERTRSNSFNRA